MVNEYKYLGLMFTSSGSFKEGILNIRDRALKAIFKIKSYLKDTDISPLLGLGMFRQLIKPICTYGSEVWYINECNVNLNKDWSLEGTFDKNPIEKIFLGFCKYLLGVNRKSCNAAVRGELGVYPICIDMIYNSVNFWHHLHNMDNVYLINARKTSEKLWQDKLQSWHKNMHKLCQCIGYRICKSFIPSKFTNRNIKNTLKNRFKDYWRSTLTKSSTTTSGKLSTYREIKSTLICEDYIREIKNIKHRHALSSLRISSHQLQIERGRYTTPITPRELRICQYCDLDMIEDERHFLMECPKHNEYRNELFDTISKMCKVFNSMSSDNKFKYLLTSGGTICKLVAKFCFRAFEARKI